MKLEILLVAVIIVVIAVIAIPSSAFAQEAKLITVSSSKETYNEGETIVISGKVSSIIQDTPITIRIIFEEKNIIHVAQFSPADDGTYARTIRAQGSLWSNHGEYTVRASYGVGNIAETTFRFLVKDPPWNIKESFEVQVPDSTSTFDVGYNMIGGTLESITMDRNRFSVTAIIDATEDGRIGIELPRNSIDAKTGGCDGEDEAYIVFIDDVQVPYQKEDVTREDRIITVSFHNEDRNIEIIGTCVIPEFGSIAIIILAISTISIIALSRKNTLKI